MSFEDRVALHSEELSGAQRRVVQVVLSDREGAAFMPAEEVARRAGVSVATTVRLAQRLGFDGYPAMRGLLQDDLRASGTLGKRVSGIPSDGGLLATLWAQENTAMQAAMGPLTDDVLNDVAASIVTAERLFIHARGHSTAVGELLERRIRRLGTAVHRLRGDGRDIAEQLHLLRPGDVVFTIALRSSPPHYAAIAAHAATRRATTIVIADAVGPLLRPQPDHLLAASRGPHDAYQTVVVPTLLAEAVAVAVARAAPSAPAVLDRLEALIDELGT